jgi:rod shape-determining protein MreD
MAFIVVVLQLSVREVMTLHSIGSVSPDLVACLATFIVLFAARSTALWACWILGLVMDLAPAAGDTAWHLIGPNALGYTFGGYLVLQLRTMVFRRRAITTGLMTFFFLLGVGVVATFLLTVRHWYIADTPLYHSPLGELWLRIKIAVYSGAVAIPFGWFLQITIATWGFQGGATRRSW